jgi:hypothetical protein
MADIIVDGQVRVSFVPTIANVLAPSAASLNAGTILHDTITPAGAEGFDPAPGEVDNTAYGSTFDTKLPGTSSFSGTRLVLKKQDGTDTVHATLSVFNTSGYIVFRFGKPKGSTFAAADKVTIYPIRTGAWAYMAPARNEVLKYWVATPVSTDPVFDVAVVA